MNEQTGTLEVNTLVKQAQLGDKDAFAALYERYLPKISQFLYFKTTNREVSSDLAQQTFLNAWQSIRSYRDVGLSFSAWLYRIAHNLLVDYLRKNQKAIRIYDLLENLVKEPEFVNQTFDQDQLDRAIAQLGDTEQQVILLRFVEGLTIEEIGKVLDKQKGTVSTIQHRALKKLKDIVEK